ncbi:hypothetical protein DL767_002826 [Monosporascus sp. MG133]|nr:hypothetical protein DL767_002826 [Monosporascus sp. MG133]
MYGPRHFINGAYYPSWRVYKGLPPSALQLDCINRVYYAFVLVNEDGSLRLQDEYADCQIPADGTTGCISALAKLKEEAPHLRALVSIGGGSGSKEFPVLTADPSSRGRLAYACRQFVDEHGLDGVDVDWEHPEDEEQGRNYISLLEALRQALPAPRYELTTAVSVGEWVLKHIDLYKASYLLDYLNLMSYDFNGPWTDVCGHQAQLFPLSRNPANVYPALRQSAHAAVEYIVGRGFPAHKIVLGIPAYARSFAGAHGIGQPFRSHEEMDYVDLPREWVHNAQVDHNVGTAFYVDMSEDGKGFVSFDVPASVRRKAEYVRWRGLGGLFYWTGTGDIRGPESLMRAGCRALNG